MENRLKTQMDTRDVQTAGVPSCTLKQGTPRLRQNGPRPEHRHHRVPGGRGAVSAGGTQDGAATAEGGRAVSRRTEHALIYSDRAPWHFRGKAARGCLS